MMQRCTGKLRLPLSWRQVKLNKTKNKREKRPGLTSLYQPVSVEGFGRNRRDTRIDKDVSFSGVHRASNMRLY